MNDVLEKLTAVLKDRRDMDSEKSYVASLHKKGLNKILEKVGEECNETIIAAKDAERTGNNADLVHEVADLWFHTLVLLSHLGSDSQAILEELEQRFGLSGLEEKRKRIND